MPPMMAVQRRTSHRWQRSTASGSTWPHSTPKSSEDSMQSTEQTTRRKALGIGAKAGALAMALLITLGSSGEIGAQPPSGGDTHQRQCRKMYDDAADLIAEYKRVGLANPNSPRLTAILF